MKRSLAFVFLTFIASTCTAQWKNAGSNFQCIAFGVHETTLYEAIVGNGIPDVRRFVPSGPGWAPASNGIDLSKTVVRAFASLGRYFFAENYAEWVTTDEGASWKEFWGSELGTNGRYLFVGWASIYGGTYTRRSRDTGQSWDSVASFEPKHWSTMGNCIFAAAYDGLYRSLDTGGIWTQLSPPFEAGMYTIMTMGSLLFLNDNSSASVTKYPGAVSMSTDSGLHWNPITVDSAGVKEFVNCLATDGKNLFAGTGQGVFVSTDTGQTWKPENDGFGRPNINLLCVFDTLLFANCWGDVNYPHTYMRPIREMLPPKSAVQQPVALRDTLAIYPNPATGLVTILVGGTAIERVSVLSVLGVEVLTLDKPGGMSHNSEITLDLSKLPSGTYFLRIQTASSTVLRKVVRE